VTKELGQVVSGFTGEGAKQPVNADKDALCEKLRALRASIVEADAEERALLDRCQTVGT
jgi:hypothetical protein